MERRWIPFLTLVGAGGACVAITLANPGDEGIPLCPTKALLGFDCPFCGGLRAVAALGHGNLVQALDHNVLLVALLPLAAVWWVLWARSHWTDRPPPKAELPNWAWNSIAAFLVAFTVVRNLRGNSVSNYLASSLVR